MVVAMTIPGTFAKGKPVKEWIKSVWSVFTEHHPKTHCTATCEKLTGRACWMQMDQLLKFYVYINISKWMWMCVSRWLQYAVIFPGWLTHFCLFTITLLVSVLCTQSFEFKTLRMPLKVHKNAFKIDLICAQSFESPLPASMCVILSKWDGYCGLKRDLRFL